MVRSAPDLTGRVAAITGANRGIGRAVAEGLARAGARVVLVCRRQADGDAAAQAISSSTGNTALEVVAGDLGERVAVRRVAEEIVKRHPRLHVLVNNAGIALRRRELTAEGMERTLAVNHLAYFELTLRLLPSIRAVAAARIVCVSSESHQGARIDFDDLENAKDYGGVKAYGRSKLMNVLFTYELARRLARTGISVNCMHPGVIATRILTDYMPMLKPLAKVVGGTPEQGADTILWLATAPELEGVSGKYFIKRREARSSAASHDLDLARRLWEESVRLTDADVVLTHSSAR